MTPNKLEESPARERWQQIQRESAGRRTSERALAKRPANGRWQLEDQRMDAGNLSPVNSCWQLSRPANGRWRLTRNAQQMDAGGQSKAQRKDAGDHKPSERTLAIIPSPERNTERGVLSERGALYSMCERKV